MSNLSSNATAPSLQNLKEQKCSAPIETEYIFHSIFLVLIMILTFIGNLLVLLAVIFFRRLRSITNYFIVSLAVSDFLISVMSLPFRLDQNIHNANWCRGLEVCQTWLIVDTACTFASMWNLAVISIDRALAIKKPFHYRSLMTHKVGFSLIAAVWTYSVVMALSVLTNWTEPGKPHFSITGECGNRDPYYYTIAAVSMSFFLPLLIIIVMYGMVFEVALNQTRALAALQVDIGQGGRTGRGGRRNSINLIREVKAAKTLAIVIGCFIVCWLPFNIILLIILWKIELIIKVLNRKGVQALSMTFIYVLPALNSTMNPIIYALFNRDFRQAFKQLGKRMAGTRLGAVGYGGSMMSSASTVDKTADDYVSKGPASKAIRFDERESDSSNHRPPNIPQHNDAYNEHEKTPQNNMKNIDTHSMETTLDDCKKTTSEHVMTLNGSVNKDECTSNDVINSDPKATENDELELARVNNNKKLPPIQTSPSQSSTDQCPQPLIGKANTLPPIESNNKHWDNKNTELDKNTEGKRDGSLVEITNKVKDDDLDSPTKVHNTAL